MSRASSSRRGVYVEGPKNDVFTALLAVALAAIVLACIFLVLEWGTYDFKTSPTGMLDVPGTAVELAWQPAAAGVPAGGTLVTGPLTGLG